MLVCAGGNLNENTMKMMIRITGPTRTLIVVIMMTMVLDSFLDEKLPKGFVSHASLEEEIHLHHNHDYDHDLHRFYLDFHLNPCKRQRFLPPTRSSQVAPAHTLTAPHFILILLKNWGRYYVEGLVGFVPKVCVGLAGPQDPEL